MPQIYPYSPGSGGGDSESDLGDEKSAFLPIIHDSRKRPLRQRLVYIGYGTLLAISWLIAFSCIGLQYSDYKHACDFVRSWETGLSTEFEPAWSKVELEKIRFTTGIYFDDKGNAYRNEHPNMNRFIGAPTPEMDAAWEELIGARYFSITDEEAQHVGGEENHKTWDKAPDVGYMTGFDMFHTLHCVNMLRKGLDADYYYPGVTIEDHHLRAHTDHCLDHIRQSTLCHADMTPLTSIYWPAINTSFAHSEQTHVCRKFEPIREFVTSRFNGSEAVVPLKGSGTRPKGPNLNDGRTGWEIEGTR